MSGFMLLQSLSTYIRVGTDFFAPAKSKYLHPCRHRFFAPAKSKYLHPCRQCRETMDGLERRRIVKRGKTFYETGYWQQKLFDLVDATLATNDAF